MSDSKKIAGIVGLVLIALSPSEVLNAQIWANVPATQTYLAGCLWFVAGLSIVRAHNRWVRSWPVVLTVMGWFIMFGGLGRMFFPEASQENTPSGIVVLAAQTVLFAVGIFLTIMSYRREKSGEAKMT